MKYLSSLLDVSGKLERELSTRKGRALALFGQFERLPGSKHLVTAAKVSCYKAIVQHPSVMEMWALSKKQFLVLERVHTSCLTMKLGVKLSDRNAY